MKTGKSPDCDRTIKRKKLIISSIALALFVIVGSLVPLSAQAPVKQGDIPELRVAVFIAPPMVVEQNGSLTGFSIDLWSAIATRLKVTTSYQIMPDANALEEAMRSKSADLSPAIAITSVRDDVFDFSYPILETGLQIMVRETGATQGTTSRLSPVWDMLRLLFSRTTIEWLGVGLLLVLVPAHVVWFLERRQQGGIITNRSYFPGIFEACYWGLATLAAQVEIMPRQWMARGLAVLWMFASVVFIASYTAELTTTLTVEKIRGAIEGPDDLPGKQIATITSSIAVVYLREQKIEVQEFPAADQVFRALLDKKVDAVVMQAPLLLYFASHEGKGLVKVVGPEFDRRPVAIEVQLDSPLRKKIDRALVTLREHGTYQLLYVKWFGGP
ncbi:MAG: transporter substrate-binding domain-containing protein [Candidatus Acidiferrales bacterium]